MASGLAVGACARARIAKAARNERARGEVGHCGFLSIVWLVLMKRYEVLVLLEEFDGVLKGSWKAPSGGMMAVSRRIMMNINVGTHVIGSRHIP